MRHLTIFVLIMGLINWTGLSGQDKKSFKPFDQKWNDVKNRIYPMLKQTVSMTDKDQIIELKESEKPVYDSYLADIHIVYLIDFKSFFTYVNQGQLIKWNISKDSLSKTAQHNLDSLANGQAQFVGDSAFAMITLNGNVEASLMLSNSFWSSISDIMKNQELIIGIPARDVLLVTHSDCKEGLEKLREGVKKTYELGDHVITKWIFKRDHDKWIQLEQIE